MGGRSDVFVAAADAKFGKDRWVRQLGTEYVDKLEREGGVACGGGTRGAIQRYREVVDEDSIRGASDAST